MVVIWPGNGKRRVPKSWSPPRVQTFQWGAHFHVFSLLLHGRCSVVSWPVIVMRWVDDKARARGDGLNNWNAPRIKNIISILSIHCTTPPPSHTPPPRWIDNSSQEPWEFMVMLMVLRVILRSIYSVSVGSRPVIHARDEKNPMTVQASSPCPPLWASFYHPHRLVVVVGGERTWSTVLGLSVCLPERKFVIKFNY